MLVSAVHYSILLILRADIDTIYLRSESFKLIIDCKQLVDAIFFYIRILHTFNRMHIVQEDERILKPIFVKFIDRVLRKGFYKKHFMV